MRVPGIVLALTAALVLTGTATAAAHPPSSPLDQQWLTTSMQGDRFELIGARQAEQISKNPKVLALAAILIKDHTKSLKKAVGLAHRFGVPIPHGPTFSQRWELHMARSLSGRSFDRWYSALEVEDHKQDISESINEGRNGLNPAVRRDARSEIGTLKRHERMSRVALAAA
jgi:putative membrane protein